MKVGEGKGFSLVAWVFFLKLENDEQWPSSMYVVKISLNLVKIGFHPKKMGNAQK